MKTSRIKNMRVLKSELKRAKTCYEVCRVRGLDNEAMYWYGYSSAIELMLVTENTTFNTKEK